MTISIAARKAKGRKLQQTVRDLILSVFDLMPDDVVSTSMGVAGVDLRLSPRAREVFNFDVECKHDNNKSVWACWAQARKNATKGKPLLIMKKDRHETLAIMSVQDWMDMVEELDKYRHPREPVL